MVKKAVSSGSDVSVTLAHKFLTSRLRRGPRNDIQVVQRIAWTNVSGGIISEQGADIYE